MIYSYDMPKCANQTNRYIRTVCIRTTPEQNDARARMKNVKYFKISKESRAQEQCRSESTLKECLFIKMFQIVCERASGSRSNYMDLYGTVDYCIP